MNFWALHKSKNTSEYIYEVQSMPVYAQKTLGLRPAIASVNSTQRPNKDQMTKGALNAYIFTTARCHLNIWGQSR